MRKLTAAAASVMLTLAVLAVPASASFDRHFTVLERNLRVKGESRFKAKLFDPRDRHERVGREWGKCRPKGDKLRCRVRFPLNGKIGGSGDIRAGGGIGGNNDNRFEVFSGTGDFNGVAGKVLVRDANRSNETRLHFDLVR
jgi:hypothetical protein